MTDNDKDNNDNDDFGVESRTEGPHPDDVIDVDVEKVDMPPSSPFSKSGGLDLDDGGSADITGDPEQDFADPEEGESSHGVNLKKMAVPAMILVLALGVGGYILANPSILSNKTVVDMTHPQSAYAGQGVVIAQEQSEQNMFATDLPQPIANQNDVPRLPNGAEGAEEIQIASLGPDDAAVEGPFATAPDAAFIEEGASEYGSVQENMPDLTEENIPQKSFEMAQADITEVTGAAPPKMPEKQAPSKKTSAPARPSEEQALLPVVTDDPSRGVADAPVDIVKDSSEDKPDVYYDGRIPTGPLASTVGPRKVDPLLEPAQQFVVVKKAHEATDIESMVVAANRALKLKRYDSALEMYQQLYERNPRDVRILMGKAVAQQNSGLTESAIKTYEELLDVSPKNTDAMLNMLGLIRQQYPSVALRRLMDLNSKYPDNAGIVAQIGVTQADLGNNEDAMRYLGIASSLEPKNAQHLLNMAIISDRQGQAKQAIKYYEKALELDSVYSGGRVISRENVYDRLSTLRRRS